MTASLVLMAALDLGALFANKEAWSEKPEIFAVDHKKEGFAFASESRDQVNCLDPTTCVWNGLKVWEARVFFNTAGEEPGVSRVEMSLYNRGDASSKLRKFEGGRLVETDRGDKLLESVIGKANKSIESKPEYDIGTMKFDDSCIAKIKETADEAESLVGMSEGIDNVLGDICELCDEAVYKLTRLS